MYIEALLLGGNCIDIASEVEVARARVCGSFRAV